MSLVYAQAWRARDWPAEVSALEAAVAALKLQLLEAQVHQNEAQVRKTPCWPRSWANFSLL